MSPGLSSEASWPRWTVKTRQPSAKQRSVEQRRRRESRQEAGRAVREAVP